MDHVISLLQLGRDFVEDVPVVEAVDVAGAPRRRRKSGEVNVNPIEDSVREVVSRVKKPEACSCSDFGNTRVISNCVSDDGVQGISEALFPNEVLVIQALTSCVTIVEEVALPFAQAEASGMVEGRSLGHVIEELEWDQWMNG